MRNCKERETGQKERMISHRNVGGRLSKSKKGDKNALGGSNRAGKKTEDVGGGGTRHGPFKHRNRKRNSEQGGRPSI